MAKSTRIDPKELASNPRADLKSWVKYHNIVIAAYKQHPNAYIYRPQNMAASTIASRIRDAIRGAIAFDYPSEIFAADLARWFDEIIVRHDKEQVFIGPKKILATSPLEHSAGATKDKFHFDTLSLTEVLAFVTLLNNGRLIGPVIIKSPPDVSTIDQTLYDNLVLQGSPDGSLTLL